MDDVFDEHARCKCLEVGEPTRAPVPPACLAAAQNGAYFTQGAAEILPGGVDLRVAGLPPSPIICQKVDPTVLSFDNKSLLSQSYDKTTLTLEGSCRSAGLHCGIMVRTCCQRSIECDSAESHVACLY